MGEDTKYSDHYILSGGRRLRCGYTTGTCAALAASGAAQRLLLSRFPEKVSLSTPKGWNVEVPLEEPQSGDGWASCGVRKDGGDDIDETNGALICARVEQCENPGIHICGGIGVGRVTRPGLDQPVGESAINHVPREMITHAVKHVCDLADEQGGLRVTVFVPDGERIAQKTFNPNLGIKGGISILGTSGVVEPMSAQAMTEAIALELGQNAVEGHKRVILTPGNYGMDFLRQHGFDCLGVPVVRCSNFIGTSLDAAGDKSYEEVLLVGHVGKLIKVAAGIMNTHSKWADGRSEIFCAHAAVLGASADLCRALMQATTTDACLELLEPTGLLPGVMQSILQGIEAQLWWRADGHYKTGAILFSNVYGELGRTSGAKEMLKQWER